MKSRLDAIENWEELARNANYNVTALAEACGVNVRQLRRFLRAKTGQAPHVWLSELRHMDALALLAGPNLIKEVADQLGYKRISHFSADFKQHHGLPPREARSPSSNQERVL